MKSLLISCCALFLLFLVAQPVFPAPIDSLYSGGSPSGREMPFRYFLHTHTHLLEIGFQARKPEQVRIKLLDVAGQILSDTRSIVSSISPNVYVKAAAFSAGIYLLEVQIGSQHYVEKVVMC